MKWLAAAVDGIGERFALMLVAGVWLLSLGAVAILGERLNAASLAALRASDGKEVIGMKRSYVLALALCAGCAVGDPGGGSSLLPATDAAGGSRTPVPVGDVDAGDRLDNVGIGPDVAPVAADAVAAAVDLASPADALPFAVCRAPGAPAVEASSVCRGSGRLGGFRKGGLLCATCPGMQYPCVAPMASDYPAGFGSCYVERFVACVATCGDCDRGGEVCQ